MSGDTYDKADFVAAEWEIALRGSLLDVSRRPLLLALIEIADGLIAELDALDVDPDRTAASQGVSAFSYGFLIAAGLREQELSSIRLELLPEAVAGVAARGRHVIIAAECDLQGFADVQLQTIRNIVGKPRGRGGLQVVSRPPARLERMFESGFALGLLLCDSPTATTP
jgi:hypothetical protein